MPEISRFYGIVIRMYMEAGERHHLPHFHAYYQEHMAIFAIDPVAQIQGILPNRQRRLVEAWAEIHKEEIIQDWHYLQSGEIPVPIAPLQ
jgi:hypothetical protein